ncbi:MAG: DUF389 domain-containing protein [Pseudomonadota bacterium]|nr:DUF389 domain-containing protein [Pseudomonadota bacterium]
MAESKLPRPESEEQSNSDSNPTLKKSDDPELQKYERLKEKLRYKRARRESERKINHKEVRLSIEAGALPSKTFYIMNSLSAVIAGYGLLANSPAVVIGAMLVAMMLGPISGVALALIDYRVLLLRTSLLTLCGGLSVVIGVGIVLGIVHHDLPMTAEIMARTQPNVMDLMIALAGGAAGAFASISTRLSVAVVGVAVATALVPPLVAGGILLAHFDWSNAFGALLLAFVNMVAIQFSSSLVLWIAGFRRLGDEELANTHLAFVKRNIVSLLLLTALGIYLTLNLLGSMAQQRYQSTVAQQLNQALQQGNNVLITTQFVRQDQIMLVRAVLRGDQAPTPNQVQQIEQALPQSPSGRATRVQVRFVPVQIIQAPDLGEQPLKQQEAKQLGQRELEQIIQQ